jgi:hypothetical protein
MSLSGARADESLCFFAITLHISSNARIPNSNRHSLGAQSLYNSNRRSHGAQSMYDLGRSCKPRVFQYIMTLNG